jgi:hypothetical protein
MIARGRFGAAAPVCCSTEAGEALGRDAEFVAFLVLQDGPSMPAYAMFADDRGTEPDEMVNGIRVWIHQVEMDAVLACFDSGALLKYRAGSRRSPSAPPMEAKNSLLP